MLGEHALHAKRPRGRDSNSGPSCCRATVLTTEPPNAKFPGKFVFLLCKPRSRPTRCVISVGTNRAIKNRLRINTVILSLFGEVMLADNIYMWALERLIHSAAPRRASRGRGVGGCLPNSRRVVWRYEHFRRSLGSLFPGWKTDFTPISPCISGDAVCVCFRWGLWTQQVL